MSFAERRIDKVDRRKRSSKVGAQIEHEPCELSSVDMNQNNVETL